MPYNRLSTAKIARAVGCHPNTVRLYEQWGFIPPVERNQKGYRLYQPQHLEQMLLARLALHGDYPGRVIRSSAAALVRQAATGDLGGALETAYRHLGLVKAEHAQADAAADLMERWAQGTEADANAQGLHTVQVIRLLGITRHTLRHWVRNNLVEPPRHPGNRYRIYGQAQISRLRVIRMLARAGYSTAAIHRMLLQLDRGQSEGLRQVLDTPQPHEDVYYAADHWISTLKGEEQRAQAMIKMLEERIAQKH